MNPSEPRIPRQMLGRSTLELPRILFGTAVFGDAARVTTEQARMALCDAILRYGGSPSWIELSLRKNEWACVEVLVRLLRKLEVSSSEVVIHLTMDASQPAFASCWEKACHLLGEDFQPRLLGIEHANDAAIKFARKRLADGQIESFGLAAPDGRNLEVFRASYDPDWMMLNGYTLMRNPLELWSSMKDLATNHTPIILSGIFEGGFLLGGNRWLGRELQTAEPADRSLLAWRKAFVALCDGFSVSPADACIQFALQAPGVHGVHLNAARADQIVQYGAATSGSVPEGFWESMKEEGLLISPS